MLTLVLPSVLLSAFAIQAVEAQRRATLAERSSRLQDAARERAAALQDTFVIPALALEREVAELDSATTPQLAAALQALVQEQPLLQDAFVLGASGERLIPAARAEPPPLQPWPSSAASALGGGLGAWLPRDPAETLRAAREERDSARAVELLSESVRFSAGPLRLSLLAELGRLLERRDPLPAIISAPSEGPEAAEVYAAMATAPVYATDLQGRPAGAQGRFRLALVLKPQQPELASQVLQGLLSELERSALLLPADQLEQVAQRAAALLEEPAARERARVMGENRRRAEARVQRLETLFGQVLSVLSREGSLPRISAPNLEGAETRGVSFVKARVGERVTMLTHSVQPVSQRLIALQWDPDALRRRFEERVSSPLWEGELLPWTDTLEGSSEVGVARMAAPFEHLGVTVQPQAEPPTGALDLSQGKLQLSGIGLALLGILMGVFVTLRTVQRESKEAQLKSDFVSNVTHELKTPLTSIQMFLETLLLGRVNDEAEVRECLTVMDREARRLTRLIEQLLVFSRIEGRKWRVRFSSENPRGLVEEAIKILADQLHTTPKELGIEVVAVQEIPPVAVDRFAVVEALLNLLHNAWKYSPNPDRAVRVVLTNRRREVEIAVEDNGMGVPRRDRRRIFVKFERASNAEKSRVEGSGIGLTLASEIAKAHGGRVRYAPNKPKGSRFAIVLPR